MSQLTWSQAAKCLGKSQDKNAMRTGSLVHRKKKFSVIPLSFPKESSKPAGAPRRGGQAFICVFKNSSIRERWSAQHTTSSFSVNMCKPLISVKPYSNTQRNCLKEFFTAVIIQGRKDRLHEHLPRQVQPLAPHAARLLPRQAPGAQSELTPENWTAFPKEQIWVFKRKLFQGQASFPISDLFNSKQYQMFFNSLPCNRFCRIAFLWGISTLTNP